MASITLLGRSRRRRRRKGLRGAACGAGWKMGKRGKCIRKRGRKR